MGLLINGQWHDQWYDTEKTAGKFVRETSQWCNWITPMGKFTPEINRYHLYISHACPWCDRTLILRKLKNLDSIISYSSVHPHMLRHGWEFRTGETTDPLHHCHYLHEIYTKADAHYSGRVTVPILWDKQYATIVNNESTDIMRMLNSAFADFTTEHNDYYPLELRSAINKMNTFIYNNINNGVYRCGFATTQVVYEEAYADLFTALEHLETLLAQQRYLIEHQLTEADWRLFVTLVRFDSVYYSHFKCNKKRISDYPNLSNYLRDLYQHRNVGDLVRFDHIKQHYYYSHITINPTQIVPTGPDIDLTRSHDRERFNNYKK